MRRENRDHRVPGESADYRAARDRLLDQEIKLPRLTEAMAVSQPALPTDGPIPQDHALDGVGRAGAPRNVKLSELFRPGKPSLAIYNLMFPRDPDDPSAEPAIDNTALLPLKEGPCHHAQRCSTNSTMPPSTPPSTPTSPSSRTRHSHGRSPSPRSAAGVTFASRPRPPTPTTACSTATRTQPVTSGAQTLLRPNGQRSGPASHQHPRAALEPPRSHPRRTSQRLARAAELLTSDDDNGHPGSRFPTRMPWRPAVQSATISVMSLGVSSAGRRGFGRRARAKWDAVELRREDRRELFAGLAHQPLRCTTSSKGRRFKRVPGLSGRSAG